MAGKKNKGCGMYYPVYDDASKRSLAANCKGYHMQGWQQVFFFVVLMVLSPMSDIMLLNKMGQVHH